MGLEMSQSSFKYAVRAAEDYEERESFLGLIRGNQKDRPSELYRGIMSMFKKYFEHIQDKAGRKFGNEEVAQLAYCWMGHSTYILAGLYAMYGKTLPRLRPGLVEKMEKDCDTREKILEREALLRSFGEGSNMWIDYFLRIAANYSSPFHLCFHGIAYIYVLGAAFIHEMEDTSDYASSSESDCDDLARRIASFDPALKNVLEKILEEAQF
jgi:hypothetical protein